MAAVVVQLGLNGCNGGSKLIAASPQLNFDEITDVAAAAGHRGAKASAAIPTISASNVQRSLPSPFLLIRNIDFL